MNPSALSFDAATHTYRFGGREIPSVTGIIRSFVSGWQASDWHKERGTAVHAAVALALNDRLDWKSLDPRIVGRVNAILQFIDDEKLTVEAVECRMASPRWRYAGTADLIATNCNGLVCADWKGSLCPEASIQLGAYVLLWNAQNPKRQIKRALAVGCRDDASYKCQWLTARELVNAGNVFLNMLSVYGWKAQNNLLSKAD